MGRARSRASARRWLRHQRLRRLQLSASQCAELRVVHARHQGRLSERQRPRAAQHERHLGAMDAVRKRVPELRGRLQPGGGDGDHGLAHRHGMQRRRNVIDARKSGAPSGGCEVVVDPLSWSKLVEANRGASNPISITVRGTTDGICASTSINTIHLSIAEQDLLGSYYYWKSTVSANGVGGQIFAKVFGDLNTPDQDVTTAAIKERHAATAATRSLATARGWSFIRTTTIRTTSTATWPVRISTLIDAVADEPRHRKFPGGITGVRHGGGGAASLPASAPSIRSRPST